MIRKQIDSEVLLGHCQVVAALRMILNPEQTAIRATTGGSRENIGYNH